ncbi:MAG: cysteine desulfurase [Ruminiclostridium sp.]|nr:cysteine desulfurase [Ruminiclostridium sp.]
MIYLDNSATTRPFDSVIKAVSDNMAENFGNASSLHGMGVRAEKVLKDAKAVILGKLGLDGNIIFTSGATESNNTVLSGIPAAHRHGGNRIVTTSFEHPSVAKPLEKLSATGYDVVKIRPPKRDEPQDFEQRVINAVDGNTLMVSVMWVNNETGFITDTAKIYNAVRRINPKIFVHVDAVQGFCKLPAKTLRADLISLSAHKIHGIKGIGALYCAKGTRFEPLLYGGGQQSGIRSGTEPIDLIAGFAEAVRSYPDCTEKYAELNERLISRLSQLDGVVFNSYGNAKNILNFSVRGVRSEIMLHFLEEREIYVSSGSACSKGKTSGVLAEFGVSDKDADCAIRVSMSPSTAENDIDALAVEISNGIKRFRR